MILCPHKENPIARIGGVLALAALGLAGCAAPSSNMRLGTDQSYISLQDQRESTRAVAEAKAVPPGATVIGPVDAARCHRFAGDIEPTNDQLILDLKVAAYARGADGIADIEFSKDSGLTKNCWYILTGKATMYRLPGAAAKQ